MSLSEADLAQRLAEQKKRKEDRIRKGQERRRQLDLEAEEQRRRADERHRRKLGQQRQSLSEDKESTHREEQLQRDKDERDKLTQRLHQRSNSSRQTTASLSAHLDETEQRLHASSSSPPDEETEKRKKDAQLRALRRDRLRQEIAEEDGQISQLRQREEEVRKSLQALEERAKLRREQQLLEQARENEAIADVSRERAALLLNRWALASASIPSVPKVKLGHNAQAERVRALIEAKKQERRQRDVIREAKAQLAELSELKQELDRLRYLYAAQHLEFNQTPLWAAIKEMDAAQATVEREEGALLGWVMKKKMLLISLAQYTDA